jgi:von Willebrand factor A domain-containing protein 8
LEAVSKPALPAFPQTALVKLYSLIALFPPSSNPSPGQLAQLFLTIHPSLVYAPFQAWTMLSQQTKESGLGELGSPFMIDSAEDIGLFGYQIVRIERENEYQVRVFFEGPQSTSPIIISVPAGPLELRPFPFTGNLEFHLT